MVDPEYWNIINQELERISSELQPESISYCRKCGCSWTDADEVFQIALIRFKNILEGKLTKGEISPDNIPSGDTVEYINNSFRKTRRYVMQEIFRRTVNSPSSIAEMDTLSEEPEVREILEWNERHTVFLECVDQLESPYVELFLLRIRQNKNKTETAKHFATHFPELFKKPDHKKVARMENRMIKVIKNCMSGKLGSI